MKKVRKFVAACSIFLAGAFYFYNAANYGFFNEDNLVLTETGTTVLSCVSLGDTSSPVSGGGCKTTVEYKAPTLEKEVYVLRTEAICEGTQNGQCRPGFVIIYYDIEFNPNPELVYVAYYCEDITFAAVCS